MPTAQTVGERIRLLRVDKQYTQKKLARLVGTTETAISNYEAGNRIPKDDIKRKIAGALGTTVGDLFFRDA